MYDMEVLTADVDVSAEKNTCLSNSSEVTHMTDMEIVTLFENRDKRAVSAVSEKYGAGCTGLAVNILRNREDAEQCVNDVYLKVWDSIPPEKPRSLCAFMGKITRNLAIDRYRKEHTEKRGGGEIPLILDELSECVSDGSSVEKTVLRNELLAAINRFLEELPAPKRIAFVSRYCLCEDVKSIARRLGTTCNSVSVGLNRTRKSLVSYLNKEGFEI